MASSARMSQSHLRGGLSDKSEVPLVCGGQGRNGVEVIASAAAILVLTVVVTALALVVVLCRW